MLVDGAFNCHCPGDTRAEHTSLSGCGRIYFSRGETGTSESFQCDFNVTPAIVISIKDIVADCKLPES